MSNSSDVQKVARMLADTMRAAQGQARTQQLGRSSIAVPLVGEDGAMLVDMPLDGLLGQVPELGDAVAGHDGELVEIDDSASRSAEDLNDLVERGDEYTDEAHEGMLDSHVLWEYALEIDAAHQELVEVSGELDEKLTSARTDLEAAEQRLDETEQRVTDSETQIGGMLTELDTAMQDAAQAQLDATLARGMLSVKPAAPVAADGQGKPLGAMWIHHAASGIQTLYEWTALGWVPRPLSETIIPKVAIGTGTYGELDGIRIKADSVFAKSLAVGDFTNYASIDAVRGVDVTIPSEYATKNDGTYTTRGTGAQNYIMFKDRTDTLPFKGGEQLRVTFRAKAAVASSAQAVVWAYPAKAGGSASGNVSAVSATITIGVTEAEFSTVIAIPAGFGGAATLQSWIAGLRPAGGADMANVSIRDVRVARMAGGELIVDGAVGAQHVATGTLQALAATITEAWIRNAHIVELDVSKLNVTGTASMKQAVIDEIWTNAVVTKMLTATEKIVTKNVIATGAIDGMTITGALIRTAPSGQRLQFDVNGLRAYDSSGTPTAALFSSNGQFALTGPLLAFGTSARVAVSSTESNPARSMDLTPDMLDLKNKAAAGGIPARWLQLGTTPYGYGLFMSDDKGSSDTIPGAHRTTAAAATTNMYRGGSRVSSYDGGELELTYKKTSTSAEERFTVTPMGNTAGYAIFTNANSLPVINIKPSGQIELLRPASTLQDTEWKTFSVSGWTIQDSSPAQARVRNGNVEFRGVLSNATFTGGFTTVGSLPAGIPVPPGSYAVGDIGMNSPVITRMRITVGGAVQFYRADVSGAWVNLKATWYALD